MQLQENQVIYRKYLKKDGFYRQMQSISKKFVELEQQVYYLQLPHSPMIVRIAADNPAQGQLYQGKPKMDYVVIFANQQPVGAKSVEKLLLQIITQVPRPGKGYCVLYINTLADKSAYSDFKKILQFLPLEYFIHLHAIYVLQASFLAKASNWLSFNMLASYVKDKTTHVSSFMELTSRLSLHAEYLFELMPKDIAAELTRNEDILRLYGQQEEEVVGVAALSVRSKSEENSVMPQMYLQNHNQQQEMPRQIFHSAIREVQKPAASFDLEDYETGESGAPLIIELLIFYFKGKEEQLATQGIFRKNASIDDQTELLSQLQNQNYGYLQKINDMHLIASTLKRFLCKLSSPLIPYPVYEQWMDSPTDNLQQLVIDSIRGLQTKRKVTLLIVLQFLIEEVLPLSERNKMSERNVSIVMAPCLMRFETTSMKDLMCAEKNVRVVAILIREFQTIFGNKRERMIMLRKSARMVSRESGRGRQAVCEEDLSFSSLSLSEREERDRVKYNNESYKKNMELINHVSLRMQEDSELPDFGEDEEFYEGVAEREEKRVSAPVLGEGEGEGVEGVEREGTLQSW